MPLGFERLNERSQRPNANINFIKPLASASPQDQAIAKDFLGRIAAQCYPVMKRDYVSVMALEEYPPNPEFLGRNFNAGEVIQLVLKDKAGRWLSFQFVQMVMMHELAHCKQMNHSRFFWQVRNRYADHMKELWGKKYSGEGLWGRGRNLNSGVFVHDRMPQGDDVPEHLCGGTYRRGGGRKRKRGHDGEKPKVTYAERQQKRIAKKFGVHGDGQGLGEDELVRGALEAGKRHQGKPKVAGSKRGRELRANAALARFEAAKVQQERERMQTPELVDDDSETESEDNEWDNNLGLGDSVKDDKGRDMFRVCGDEGDEDGGKDELEEFRQMRMRQPAKRKAQSKKRLYEDSETESEGDGAPPHGDMSKQKAPKRAPVEDLVTEHIVDTEPAPHDLSTSSANGDNKNNHKVPTPSISRKNTGPAQEPPAVDPTATPAIVACQVCSLENDPSSPTCLACANVLKPKIVPNCWRCKSDACKGSKYINAGDAGRCGLCGTQKPASTTAGSGGNEARPIGLTGIEVLRWD